jgi:hypothetical protein
MWLWVQWSSGCRAYSTRVIRPVVFGDTSTGKHLMVAFDEIDADTVYPVTAYEVPKRKRK